MIDFKNFSSTQWLNIAGFALGSLAMAGWWNGLYTPEHATMVSGGLIWASSLVNFLLTGKPPAAAAPPAA